MPAKDNEDCLLVDVFAPSNATNGTNLPVYYFIQGGAFNSNSNPNYNGTGLVLASDYNIVVVTINYRVGPYGFLAAPEVVQNGASLNNGIKDMIQGLRWVNQYIAAVCSFFSSGFVRSPQANLKS